MQEVLAMKTKRMLTIGMIAGVLAVSGYLSSTVKRVSAPPA